MKRGSRLFVELHVFRMARHEHAHELLGVAVRFLAGDKDFVDVFVIEVADGSLDKVAFLVNEARGGRFQGKITNVFPKPQQILEVALDFRLGSGSAGCADDEAHAFRNLKLQRDFLQAFAVGRDGDLARNTATARCIRHQDRIASRERQIGGERRALAAALFLDHLDQDDLVAFDNFLNFVVSPAPLVTLGQSSSASSEPTTSTGAGLAASGTEMIPPSSEADPFSQLVWSSSVEAVGLALARRLPLRLHPTEVQPPDPLFRMRGASSTSSACAGISSRASSARATAAVNSS